jgi:hypothetical protein
VRVEERRVVGAEHDVSLVDPVEGAPGRHAVHRHDERLPHVVELRRQLLARIHAVPHVLDVRQPLLHVDPGTEGAVAGRSQ